MGQSYGFPFTLMGPVADTETVEFPAQDAGAEDCALAHAELALDGSVIPEGAFKVALIKGTGGAPNGLKVTNKTGAEWPFGATLYVYTPPAEPAPPPEPEAAPSKARR